jgi:hypothetical protein
VGQNFIGCDREQELLLPPSLREWLAENHLAWFVIDAVAEMDLRAFYAAESAPLLSSSCHRGAALQWTAMGRPSSAMCISSGASVQYVTPGALPRCARRACWSSASAAVMTSAMTWSQASHAWRISPASGSSAGRPGSLVGSSVVGSRQTSGPTGSGERLNGP